MVTTLKNYKENIIDPITILAALELYKKQNQGLGMFLDNSARNALARQLIEQQFELNNQYPGLLSQ